MIVVRPPATEEEFEQYYDLRWRILRAPWGQPRGSEKDEREESSVHRAACDESGRIVGVGRLHFNSPTEAQVRYMAVDEPWRRQGVGRKILLELERIARKRGAKTVVLNAREEVVVVYRKLGYEAVGVGPVLFGSIKHTRMKKELDR